MNVSAVRLTRRDGHLVVDLETQNGWIEVIREKDDGTTPISHICEAEGLRKANSEAADQASMDDLSATMADHVSNKRLMA